MTNDWINELICEDEQLSTSELKRLQNAEEIEYLKRLTINYTTPTAK
jgi:hypothetical protein